MTRSRLLACLLALALSPVASALAPASPAQPAAAPPGGALPPAPWLTDLQQQLRHLPGFLALIPDGTRLHALFTGEAPQLPAVPAPWNMEAIPHAAAKPMMLPLPPGVRVEPTSAPTHQSVLPALAWNDGIGPGAHIYMDFQGTGNPQFLCTSNYVWKDQDGTLYLGAAGHCFLPSGTTATINAGPDGDVGPGQPGIRDSTRHNFWACWQDCLLGGNTGGILQDVVLPNAVKLGPVAYARQKQDGKDIGRDFGLITIPHSLYADVDPRVPIWGGPRGTVATRPGDQLFIHGNGNTDGETFATKSRTGASLGDNGDGSFGALLKSSGGDSGAPITTSTPLGTPKAVGLLTHGIQVPAVRAGLGYILGTTVTQAQEMAKQAGLCIAPLDHDADPLNVQPVPEAEACRRSITPLPGHPHLAITSPSSNQTLEAGTLGLSGTVDRLSSIPPPLVNLRITAKDGNLGSPIAVAATATGGTAPYHCQWSSQGASFANHSACATTVTFATPGAKALEVQLTDSAQPPATLHATREVAIAPQPGPACVTDAPADARAPTGTADPTGIYEITRACAQALLGARLLEVQVDITGLALENLVGTAASPVIYTVHVPSTPGWDAYHLAGRWQVWDNRANAPSAGTAASTGTVLTVRIPFAEMSLDPGYVPSSFRVASGVGFGLVGSSKLAMDSAPDAGHAGPLAPASGAVPTQGRLSTEAEAVPAVPADPEVTDPDGDVTGIGRLGLPSDGALRGLPVDAMDLQAAWFVSTPTHLHIGLKVKSLADPQATSQVAYTVDFKPSWSAAWNIPNGDTFEGLRVQALWSRLQADASGAATPTAPRFELQALSRSAAGPHFTPLAALPDSSLDTGRGIFWFTVPREALQAPPGGGTLTTLSAAAAPAVAGIATLGSFWGDSATSARTVQVVPRLHAAIAAPATAFVGDGFTVSAEALGGTPPYSCAWSGQATFADPGACSTTARLDTPGTTHLSVAVTDSAQPPSNIQASATVDVSNPERIEVHDGATHLATVRLATSTANPRSLWTVALPSIPSGEHVLTARWFDQDATQPLAESAVHVTVAPPNLPPVLDAPTALSVAEGQALRFTVTASDPDGDAVLLAASDLPTGASFDPGTGAFGWTPAYDQAGAHTIVLEARDGRGGQDREELAITVTPTDRPPVLDLIPNVTAPARTPIRFDVHATDPDGDAVAYSATWLPAGAALDADTGTFSWTPSKKEVGLHQVIFTATAGNLSAEQMVEFIISRH